MGSTVLETPHAIVGAAIAAKIGNPYLAIPLAFASHFILDKVPHWNPHLNTEIKKFGKPTLNSTIFIVLDVVAALVLGFFLASSALPDQSRAIQILLGAFAGVLPDVVEAPYFYLGLKNEMLLKWLQFQKSIQVDTTIVPGLMTQFITIVAAFWWVFN